MMNGIECFGAKADQRPEPWWGTDCQRPLQGSMLRAHLAGSGTDGQVIIEISEDGKALTVGKGLGS